MSGIVTQAQRHRDLFFQGMKRGMTPALNAVIKGVEEAKTGEDWLSLAGILDGQAQSMRDAATMAAKDK